jgi:hypothetical protein
VSSAPGRAGLRRQAAALGLFALLAVVLTWPLASHFTTHVTGDGIDDPALAWNLWWVKVRLVDQFAPDIFHAGWMFHPVAVNLAFYTLTPLNGLLSIPLQTGFSLVVANNLLLLSSFVLGAFGAYLLALDQLRWLTGPASLSAPRPAARVDGRFLAALAAGVIYAFASSKLFYASLGQFNIASSQWSPFCVLLLLRMVQAPRRRLRSAALAGLFSGLPGLGRTHLCLLSPDLCRAALSLPVDYVNHRCAPRSRPALAHLGPTSRTDCRALCGCRPHISGRHRADPGGHAAGPAHRRGFLCQRRRLRRHLQRGSLWLSCADAPAPGRGRLGGCAALSQR